MTVLARRDGSEKELYAVYYVVYGSLAGEDQLVKEYFWAGPYGELKVAVNKAEQLKTSHDNDSSFVVRRYKNGLGK
jgi:hypothetical protein